MFHQRYEVKSHVHPAFLIRAPESLTIIDPVMLTLSLDTMKAKVLAISSPVAKRPKAVKLSGVP